MELELYHSGRSILDGAPVGSGRYPRGSGDNPFQHERDFLDRVNDLKKQGLSEKERAEALGLSVRQLKAEVSLANGRVKEAKRVRARELYSQGMGYTAIGREFGVSESTIRGWLEETAGKKQRVAEATVAVLKKNVDEMKYIDVGKGIAERMGISENRLAVAVRAMEQEGYSRYKIRVPNATDPTISTELTVLAAPGIPISEVRANKDNIGIVNTRFEDPHGINAYGLKPIESISSKRIQIAYAEDGGVEKDGVIELRRGVEGLDLGKSMYAQVRIGVDGTHYLKGMAVYADDLPDGVDIRFNTNKHRGTPMLDPDPDAKQVLKSMKNDPNNPFGSEIKRNKKTGVYEQRGYLNIVNEEGDWGKWSKTLASQMLSKQPKALAERQLKLAYTEKMDEFAEIKSLTNPTIRKYLMNQFADSCDTSAQDLKAAAMPRQGSHVILPVNSLKPNEVYAPNYKNGESVVLIRYPHGGIFEIPELRVNNNNEEARRIFTNPKTGLQAPDAIGIHHSVAERLSGADFDGDTVLVIPNKGKAIRTDKPLKDLVNFDAKEQYKYYDGMKVISKKHMGREMGEVSNLITDMTIKGADERDIARAVKYSMVVIDSYKHKLNFQQAKKDCGIEELQKKYQRKEIPTPSGKEYGGASTIISRATSEDRIPLLKAGRSAFKVDPETGKKIPQYDTKNATYIERKQLEDGSWISTGKVKTRETKTTKMATTDDAFTLVSKERYPIEIVYAEHANRMKALANQARKEAYNIKETPYSAAAYSEYKQEADHIKEQVAYAKSKLPLERKAQAIAGRTIRTQVEDRTGLPYGAGKKILDAEDLKKIRSQAIAGARAQLQSKKPTVDINDREWEAIQKGAVSKSTFNEAIRFMDQDELKQRALPKTRIATAPTKIARAKAMLASGYTQAEVGAVLGVSASTVKRMVAES